LAPRSKALGDLGGRGSTRGASPPWRRPDLSSRPWRLQRAGRSPRRPTWRAAPGAPSRLGFGSPRWLLDRGRDARDRCARRRWRPHAGRLDPATIAPILESLGGRSEPHRSGRKRDSREVPRRLRPGAAGRFPVVEGHLVARAQPEVSADDADVLPAKTRSTSRDRPSRRLGVAAEWWNGFGSAKAADGGGRLGGGFSGG